MTVRDVMYAVWGGAISSCWWIGVIVNGIALAPAVILSVLFLVAICINAYE